MVKYNKKIERKFSLIALDNNIDVVLTSHLFIPRDKNSKKIRAYIFKSRYQYEALILSAVEDGILNYAHKGRVVYMFEALNVNYGILLDCIKTDIGYEITVITVDKIKEHNYSTSDLFYREKNKIYSQFVLPLCFSRQISGSRIDKIGDVQFFKTYGFENICKKHKHIYSSISFEKISASIFSRLKSSLILSQRIYCLQFDKNGLENIYIEISIEPFIFESESSVAVIFTRSFIDYDKFKRDCTELISMGSIDYKFSKTKPEQYNLKQNGLRIIKKAS